MSFNANGVTAPPLQDLLSRFPFLESFLAEATALLEVQGEPVWKAAGEPIVHQGQPVDCIYILLQGTARIERSVPGLGNTSVVVVQRDVMPGTLLSLIGGISLVHGEAYTADVCARTGCWLYKTPVAAWEQLLYRQPNLRQTFIQQSILNRLRTLPSLAEVDLVTLTYLTDEVAEHSLEAEEVLYTQNDPALRYYLIHEGQVKLYQPRNPNDLLWLGTGCPFGFPVRRSNVYGHWAETTTHTKLYSLPWESVSRLAARFPTVVDPRAQEVAFKTLGKVSVFDQLTDEERKLLAGYCSFQHIPQNHLLMFQGDVEDSLWILLKGGQALLTASDDQNRPLPYTTVQGIACFGETSLIRRRNVPSTVEATPGSLWLRLHWEDFERFLQLEVKDRNAFIARLQITQMKQGLHNLQDSQNRYPWLSQNEYITAETRRHFVALLPRLAWAGAGLFFGLPLALLLIAVGVPMLWGVLAGALLVVPGLFWGIVDYWNDYFIVTTQRVMIQEKVIFIREFRREALLEQVQSVNVSSSFWGNIFGYGRIVVQTAGSAVAVVFDTVPRPDALRTAIFQERGRRQARARAKERVEIQNALEQKLRLPLSLPERVRTYTVKAETIRPPRWRRWWRALRNRRKPDWSKQDHVVWHKHPFLLIERIWWALLLLLLVIGLVLGGLGLLSWQWLTPAVFVALEIVLAVAGLALLAFIVWQWIDWYNDTYEITRDRIIDVEKLPFFLRESRREALLKDVQDVQLKISTPLQMLLNYGDIVVQTAATTGAFTFDHVPYPREVQAEINRRLLAWRYEDERRRNRERSADLPEWFELYSRLKAGNNTSPGAGGTTPGGQP